MDTIDKAARPDYMVVERDYAKEALLRDLDLAMQAFKEARAGNIPTSMAYSRGLYMGLLAGLFYSCMISVAEHREFSDRMIEAIHGEL